MQFIHRSYNLHTNTKSSNNHNNTLIRWQRRKKRKTIYNKYTNTCSTWTQWLGCAHTRRFSEADRCLQPHVDPGKCTATNTDGFKCVELATHTPWSVSSMVKLQTKQGIGIPHFIMFRFIALQIHCIIYKLKARPSTGKSIMTLFIAVVWNHTQNISKVCLYYLPSMYMIRAILDNSEQIKTSVSFCVYM